MTLPRVLCSALLSLSLFASPQHSPGPPSAPPSAQLKPDDRIVLNVVVNDKSGTPVTGLRQDQFTILDNKQPQNILSFNAVSPSSPAQVEIIFVIDSVNIDFSRVAYERIEMEKFLRRDNGKLARPVSIDFFSDSGMQIQNAPSTDGNALVNFIEEHNMGLRTNRRSQGFYGAADRTQLSLRSLHQLAAYEATRPGRKVVVWVSPGWPLLSGVNVQLTNKDEQALYNMIVLTSTELRQAGITLYAVNPLGAGEGGQIRLFYYEQFLKPITKPQSAQYGNLALQVLAVHSGGRVLNASNDIAAELETCMRDSTAFYLLSYQPPPPDGPNEYHAIEVKLAQPGLKAQTQAGYYAQPGPRTP